MDTKCICLKMDNCPVHGEDGEATEGVMSRARWEKHNKKMPKVLCFWGEAEDVCVDLNGHPLHLHEKPSTFGHGNDGCVFHGSMAFTGRQAVDFALSLLDAGTRALKFDADLRDHEREQIVKEATELNDES